MPRLGQLLIGLVGLFDVGAGTALLIAPDWFYATVGEFPPSGLCNSHTRSSRVTDKITPWQEGRLSLTITQSA